MAGVVLLITSLAYLLNAREQAPAKPIPPSQATLLSKHAQPTAALPPTPVDVARNDDLLRLASLALDDENPATRSEAAFELGETDDPLARQVLEQVLYDPVRVVRRAAIDALSLDPTPDSIDILTRARSHPDSAVRDLADQALTILRGGP